jgi:hypothetical protein
MRIKSASYINLSDIASLLGMEYSDMCEYYDTKYTWGDTDVTLVNIQEVVQVLEHEERIKLMSILLAKNDPDLVSRLFVNLAD